MAVHRAYNEDMAHMLNQDADDSNGSHHYKTSKVPPDRLEIEPIHSKKSSLEYQNLLRDTLQFIASHLSLAFRQ